MNSKAVSFASRQTRTVQLSRHLESTNHLVVGLGNFRWPRSRESVGLVALDRFVNRVPGLEWEYIPDLNSDALPSAKGLTLLRPRTYLQEHMGVTVKAAADALGLSAEDITLVHYDLSIPVGQAYIQRAPLQSNNIAVESVFSHFGVQEMNRAAIGVQLQHRHKFFKPTLLQIVEKRPIVFSQAEAIFLRNIMTPEEESLAMEAADKLIDTLLQKSSKGENAFSRLNSL